MWNLEQFTMTCPMDVGGKRCTSVITCKTFTKRMMCNKCFGENIAYRDDNPCTTCSVCKGRANNSDFILNTACKKCNTTKIVSRTEQLQATLNLYQLFTKTGCISSGITIPQFIDYYIVSILNNQMTILLNYYEQPIKQTIQSYDDKKESATEHANKQGCHMSFMLKQDQQMSEFIKYQEQQMLEFTKKFQSQPQLI